MRQNTPSLYSMLLYEFVARLAHCVTLVTLLFDVSLVGDQHWSLVHTHTWLLVSYITHLPWTHHTHIHFNQHIVWREWCVRHRLLSLGYYITTLTFSTRTSKTAFGFSVNIHEMMIMIVKTRLYVQTNTFMAMRCCIQSCCRLLVLTHEYSLHKILSIKWLL